MILNVSIPHQAFNEAVKDGTVSDKLNRIMEATRPEAVYFTEWNGKRGVMVVADVEEPSRVPALAEPWFLCFNADVKFQVAMTPDDLKKSGLEDVAKSWT
jgi:hypothetical protein